MATTASQQYTAKRLSLAGQCGEEQRRYLMTIRSTYGPRETMEKLQAAVKRKGMTVFAEIDHAAGAAEAGLALRPTGLLSCNEPGWLAKRHELGPNVAAPVGAMAAALNAVAKDATGECWTLQDPGCAMSRGGGCSEER
jgi:hypothetical protein